jgi:hypothetical protein
MIPSEIGVSEIEPSQPKSVKPKMRERKKGALKPKGVKQGLGWCIVIVAVTVRSGSSNSKIKFTLEQSMKAQRGSRGIALLFL